MRSLLFAALFAIAACTDVTAPRTAATQPEPPELTLRPGGCALVLTIHPESGPIDVYAIYDICPTGIALDDMLAQGWRMYARA